MAILALLVGTAVGLPGPPATADDRDGRCETDEFCYYYRSDQGGSLSDFSDSLANYGATQPSCYEFRGPGDGRGSCIKNNAASVWNRTDVPVTVYFNSDYGGPVQIVAAGARVNLNTTLKNQNASHRFGAPTSDRPFGAPGVNREPSAIARAPRATARTQFVDDEIARLTGERDCWVGAYRDYQDSRSNHNTGNALDCTISDRIGVRPDSAQRDAGWALANWLKRYADRLQVRYVIWDGRIWSSARASEGWRTYTAGSGVTGGHFDHVHVSVQNPYGD
ncbi:peptidase inhibitor family I36 protein [Nakamurella sp.]|uniref:peptidase inhibitor family I36 protein n=1 Tax=Nakamurella sp. TaxID=1869182 RepID=UPI003B3A15D1